MRNKLFFLVLIILLILGIGILVRPQTEISKSENRELLTRLDIKDLDTLEDVLKDQFYYRDGVTKCYFELKTNINKLIGGNNNFTYLSDEVIDIGDGYLINDILKYDEQKDYDSKSRGYNLNEIDLTYPDIKTYVYFPRRIEEIININGIENYGNQYNKNFVNELNSKIKVGYLNTDSVEVYKQWFYKSDYHWNASGAYQGYQDIIELINDDYDIGVAKEIIREVEYDYDFKGNIASKVGGVGESDHIKDYVIDEASFDFYVNGEKCDYYYYKNLYKEKGSDGSSDYDYYFQGYDLLRVFDYHNEDKPNILIFTDSFGNVIQQWLASHFNQTVVVDLRQNDGSFALSEIIEEYDIDIILTVEMYNNIYFNGNMYIPNN